MPRPVPALGRAGHDDEGDQAQDRWQEGVESQVKLAGTQTNVGEWLARWGMFVSSSIQEGQPVALLEAMAAGLPCVATAVGGVPDTLADGVEGVVVPPADPVALAYGRAARERVIREFSIDSLVATCTQIYSSALETQRAKAGS